MSVFITVISGHDKPQPPGCLLGNGEIKLIRKRLRKKRLTAAQKSALKKARRKAQTGAAKLARKKSMKLRRKRLG
ncbi:hypothetical protein KP541_28060 (plasmid) [Escherichia coli O111:H8]|uniref:hypothetical protein n=1 Tax=Escherichia coli TaxID=562 RepID=UPI0018E4318C